MNTWARLRFLVLILIDRLLGTRLVDRQIAQLQARIDAFEGHALALQKQMRALDQTLHLAQLQMCITHLYQRQLLQPGTWLRFVPSGNPEEEQLLDLLIAQLVRHDLAGIRTEPAGDETHIYHLQPDWEAIAACLGDWQDRMDPMIAAWLDVHRSAVCG
jgi:hypothetical protein